MCLGKQTDLETDEWDSWNFLFLVNLKGLFYMQQVKCRQWNNLSESL